MRGDALGVVAGRGDRDPLRRRAGERLERGSGALGHRGHRARDRRSSSATLIFGASLSTLVSRPPLYGWNWSYELRSGYSGISNIPEKLATRFLDRDKNIAAWTGVYFASMRLDDLTVPVIGATPHAPVEPSQLSGHGMDAANQIVLAPGTLAQLHKRVGDTVEAGSGTKRKRLVIVGTAALPAVGITTNLHTELASGAVVAESLIPTTNRGFGKRDGPEAIFVRLRTNVEPHAALLTLKRDAAGMSSDPGDGPVSVLAVQRPAEIVNYRTMGATPALLGTALAAGAASALGLTLIASVRRRRRDLALLKTLGFTRRQLAAVVIWQASVAAVIGTVAGVPIGIIVGRELWNRFAVAIHVIPQASVPGVSIALVALLALLLANLVAAIPGFQAACTPTAVLLHGNEHAVRTRSLTPGGTLSRPQRERRERDSNPRRLAPQRFSRPSHSAALAPLRRPF